MSSQNQTNIPWRERAFVSLHEAGQILARSPLFVRRQIMWGNLDAVRVTKTSPIVVTVKSVVEFIETSYPVDPAEIKATRPALRLVHSPT